jgi:hypothetical protein
MGECSATNEFEPIVSPAADRPWSIRSTMSRMGARTPIAAYVGRSPMSVVLTPMSRITPARTRLRPNRSPRAPMRNAPTGRAMKPTE